MKKNCNSKYVVKRITCCTLTFYVFDEDRTVLRRKMWNNNEWIIEESRFSWRLNSLNTQIKTKHRSLGHSFRHNHKQLHFEFIYPLGFCICACMHACPFGHGQLMTHRFNLLGHRFIFSYLSIEHVLEVLYEKKTNCMRKERKST